MTESSASSTSSKRGWQASAEWGVCLVVGYVILAGLPVALALALTPFSDGPFLEELGKGAGLLGFSLLVLQVALSARLKAVDRPFGLDVVMQFHKGMAVLAGALLLLHPVLLALGKGSLSLFSLRSPWQIYLGKIALVLLVTSIPFALLLKKLGMQPGMAVPA